MSNTDELDEILNQYASDYWMLLRFPSEGNREIKDKKLAEAKQAIEQYVLKKQVEELGRAYDYIGEDGEFLVEPFEARITELEKQLEGGE